ncbi:MAG: NAD(P)/FAD-dependent oxidoreductase [Acidimicrobiales bacterium]|nr:NAD(P)/FAD-dependent oxidoreductase [Acidimicrobiales bacterium]MCB9395760.1 NAD(P)/FAD-dependent oxidoreductase [Acidimicrobiaceae bacterium]
MLQGHHRIVIVGAGTGGIAVAARLINEGEHDIAIIDPSATHFYQPLWTLVGGGRAKVGSTVRDQRSLIPAGVRWIQKAAAGFDPDNKRVLLADGGAIGYDALVVAPGIQLDWDQLPGSAETLGRNGVSSNYTVDLAPKTWDMIRNLRSGTAVFMMPTGPIKCAGAPQKIAYLAADHWRKQGVLKNIEVVMVLPTPGMFGVPEFAKVLEQVVDRYGIQVRFQSVVSEVDPDQRQVVIQDLAGDTKSTLGYDFLHAVPPQSAPNWVKASPLSVPGDAKGWIDIDKNTMQHVRYPDVFALGDAGSSPNSKTGAAIRKQAPVVVQNVIDQLRGNEINRHYDGYASCPIVTARNKMLLAEFDYTMRPHKTVPLIDTQRERFDMYLLKRHGLPFMYWNILMKGKGMTTPGAFAS